MIDEMTDCPHGNDTGGSNAQHPSTAGMAAANQLPTLQRNALRKIFDRPAFTPEEVAALGYRRLQQAEGIGNKGLAAITAWLQQHGFELNPPDSHDSPPKIHKKNRRNIEMAVRLLRTHGYIVQGAVELPGETKTR